MSFDQSGQEVTNQTNITGSVCSVPKKPWVGGEMQNVHYPNHATGPWIDGEPPKDGTYYLVWDGDAAYVCAWSSFFGEFIADSAEDVYHIQKHAVINPPDQEKGE